MSNQTYDKPSDVVAENGRVLVDGPGHVDVAFSPEAAHVTGERLIGAAEIAARQLDGGGELPSAADDGGRGDQPGRDA